MKMALSLAALASCAYRPGSFTDLSGAFPHTHDTVGCFDVGVGFGAADHGAVVAYDFGNRCDRTATLDLASVRVVARDALGFERPLRVFDPRNEIRPLELTARWWGDEQIEYTNADSTPIVAVCVDVGGLDASQPRAEKWVCP